MSAWILYLATVNDRLPQQWIIQLTGAVSTKLIPCMS